MTIYSSTTLAELLDELDVRAPDLAAPIRERIEELEDERDAHIECNEYLEARIEELEDES